MTIQRQYSLPNCVLTLEGLSDGISTTDARPLLSILLNVECAIVGQEKPLTGGREFLDSLAVAVSYYAQEFFSGVHRPTQAREGDSGLVQLQRLEGDRHRLNVRESQAGSSGVSTPAQVLDLTTVQLFDLVEAIDQLFADSQTLPSLSLALTPVPRRYAVSHEPLSKQVVPAALGLSGLAVAASALFFLPTPQVRKPDYLTPGSAPPAATASPSPQATGSPKPGASASPQASPTTTTQTTAKPDPAQLEAILTSAPEITDPSQVESLGKKLYDQIDQAWKTRAGVSQELVYRLGVGKDGAIVGYRPVNEAAIQSVKQTPLLDLLYIPNPGTNPSQESIAQFRVIFTPQGQLKVTPWNASAAVASPSPAATTAPTTTGTTPGGVAEITDVAQVKEIQPKVYDQLDKGWKGTPAFSQDLIFRVRANSKGTIADYEPINQSAADYTQNTPLPSLGKGVAQGTQAPPAQEPLALFKVVFKPNGVLQVSPWRGRRD